MDNVMFDHGCTAVILALFCCAFVYSSAIVLVGHHSMVNQAATGVVSQ